MSQKKESSLETLETQIVVIGGGGAGLAAGVAAIEEGANDVILLEKAGKPGGNSALAGGLFAAESPTQKRMNIDAQKDLLFKIHMSYSHWTINPRLVRALIDKSGDTIRWMEEKGLDFDVRETDTRKDGSERTFFKQPVPLTWHIPKGKGLGRDIVNLFTENFKNLGGQLLCNTRAKNLSASDDGKIINVLAEKKAGEEITIKARSVIIATGGYAGNKELLRKYCPYYNDNIHLVGFPNMGDGLLMAMEMGAATEGLGILHLGPKQSPGVSHQIWVLSLQASTVWVNQRGERFVDEAVPFSHFEHAKAVTRQKDCISYTLFDKKIKRHIIESGVIKSGRISAGDVYTDSDLEKELQAAAAKGKNVKISDSLTDIAAWMGAKPETLKATIEEYNTFCDKNHDDIFAKDPEHLIDLRTPPYYAIRCVPRFYGTMGGIKINHNMEVVNHEENPIPGLYAGGIDTGGWEPETYDGFLLGHALGFSYNSGRIAGENAAGYVLETTIE